jgi:alpha-L-fucosidase
MSDYSIEPVDQQRRLAWFRAARFGMFIHWGLYAQLGRHEWVMQREQIPIPEYEKLAQTWHPKPGCAKDWARLAKAAGMRYMVLTSKHCEGFSLWDSRINPYNAVRTGPGRDLVAEYVEAARSAGLKVGLYYSFMDWHHPDGARCYHDAAARRRLLDYTHGLVHELCANYGRIDVLWYDAGWPLMTAEGWEADKLNAMVRRLQPDIVINNRSGLPEDFGTPEQHLTPEKDRMWEACMTFNHSWGYFPSDTNYKDAPTVLGMLRQVAAYGGNLLLNVGPAPDGGIPQPCVQVLGQVGEWLGQYGASIYDATDYMRQEWQVTGAFTVKGNTAYYHVRYWPGTELAIGGLQMKVRAARLMNGSAVPFKQTGTRLLLHGLPDQPPNTLTTVIELECEDKPHMILGSGYELIENDPHPAKIF